MSRITRYEIEKLKKVAENAFGNKTPIVVMSYTDKIQYLLYDKKRDDKITKECQSLDELKSYANKEGIHLTIFSANKSINQIWETK
jgi:hypothetical protein